MYKELKETTIKTCTQIILEHKGFAYLMLNPTMPVENGITLESRGTLYAIADEEGLDELYKTARTLRNQGIKVLVDATPLYADRIPTIV